MAEKKQVGCKHLKHFPNLSFDHRKILSLKVLFSSSFSSSQNLERHERREVRPETPETFLPAKSQKAPRHRGQAQQPQTFAVKTEEETSED